MAVNHRRSFSEGEIEEIDAIIEKMVDDTGHWDVPTEQDLADGNMGYRIHMERLPQIERDLRAAGRFPESIDLHSFLAINLKHQNRHADAEAHMRAQAERHPADADWQIAYAASLLGSRLPDARDRFNTEAARIYNMPLDSRQKTLLNQFSAAINGPQKLRMIDARSPVVRFLDNAGATIVRKLDEWWKGPGQD